VMSLLDRGAVSPYDLQQIGGLSQGASLPALKRLLKAKLVARSEETSPRNRKRHSYRLTSAGKEAIEKSWKAHLKEVDPLKDLDSVLRIAEIALHYGAKCQEIGKFLKKVSSERIYLRDKATFAAFFGVRPENATSYARLKAHVDAARFEAECQALRKIAKLVDRPPKRSRWRIPKGQMTLSDLKR
jgi:DNA-binding PadR family transcriptional regulator